MKQDVMVKAQDKESGDLGSIPSSNAASAGQCANHFTTPYQFAPEEITHTHHPNTFLNVCKVL